MQIKSLLINVDFPVPASIEEYEAKRGPGSCLRDAIKYSLYRGPLAAWREEFTKFLTQSTGIPLKDDESEEDYVRRVAVELGLDEAGFNAKFGADAKRLAEGISWASEPRVRRVGGAKKVSKKWLDLADKVIAAGRAATAAEKLASELGAPVEPTRESLAWAIKERESRRQAELMAMLS